MNERIGSFWRGLRSPKEIIPLPYSWYYIVVACIVLIGFFDACYLSVSHYRVYTDMEYQSFCAISRAFNCDTVSQSAYSILLGVPVPVWGIMGYAFTIFLLLFAWPQKAPEKRMWTLLLILSMGFSAYSMVLALISTYRIKSYCVMCILSYAVNLLLLYFSWVIRKRFRSEAFISAVRLDIGYLLTRSKGSLVIIGCFGICVLVMPLFFPEYWRMAAPALPVDMPTGMTAEGFPWCGAENPELVITEFADYQCFQCKKMHVFLRRIIQKNPTKIRLIHRQFPMDHKINPIVTEPLHEGSGILSLIAIAASREGKFWPMNDRLFEIAREGRRLDTKRLALDTGIDPKKLTAGMFEPENNAHLWKDIREGIRLGVTGTPAFLVDGKVYLGWLPPEVLARVVQ